MPGLSFGEVEIVLGVLECCNSSAYTNVLQPCTSAAAVTTTLPEYYIHQMYIRNKSKESFILKKTIFQHDVNTRRIVGVHPTLLKPTHRKNKTKRDAKRDRGRKAAETNIERKKIRIYKEKDKKGIQAEKVK